MIYKCKKCGGTKVQCVATVTALHDLNGPTNNFDVDGAGDIVDVNLFEAYCEDCDDWDCEIIEIEDDVK